MNVGQARVEVRERSVAEIMDLALRFTCAFGGRLYLRLFVVTALPAWGICWWALSGDDPDVLSVWALALALFALVQVPFTIAASRLMFAEAPSLREVLIASVKALLRSILTSLAAMMLLMGGAFSIVLAPAALARCLYVSEITLLEGTGVRASFGRSGRFIRGRMWHAIHVCWALTCMAGSFILSVEIVVAAVARDVLGLEMLDRIWEVFDSPAALLGLFVALPFVTSARFLAYIDGRTRREAWDVQVRFLKLGLDEQAKAA